MGLKDFFIKGKDYAQEAAYYLEEGAKKTRKGIKYATKRADTLAASLEKKRILATEKLSQGAEFVSKFKSNLQKELKPARDYAYHTNYEMLYQVGQKPKITVVSRRPNNSIVTNQFHSTQDAVNYIETAKKLGHTILKIKR